MIVEATGGGEESLEAALEDKADLGFLVDILVTIAIDGTLP